MNRGFSGVLLVRLFALTAARFETRFRVRECGSEVRSGMLFRAAEERPVRFWLDGREYLVEEVLDQWYGRDDEFFKVRADDDNLYILRHETSRPEGGWHLVSFRQAS